MFTFSEKYKEYPQRLVGSYTGATELTVHVVIKLVYKVYFFHFPQRTHFFSLLKKPPFPSQKQIHFPGFTAEKEKLHQLKKFQYLIV